jgi:RND family efflux transporter MFP subunit
MTWLRLWCGVGIGVAVLIGTGCQERVKPGTAQVKRAVVTDVRVEVARLTAVPEYYETTATVRAKNVSAIAGKVMGVVTAIHVKEGDTVTAGQELLTIDERELIQRVKAAEAGHREALKALDGARQNRSLAELTERRYRKLREGRAISQQEMDQVTSQWKVAAAEAERAQAAVARTQAATAEAQIYLGYARISAPTSGMITEKRIDVGSMAIPGTPLMLMEDRSAFRLDINVDERLSGKVVPGMQVELELDAIGLAAVDPAVRTFLIKVDVSGVGLRSGMYARVKIPLGEREAVLLPEQAIVTRGQLTGVYKVAQDGVVALTMIRAGKKRGPSLEILSGIKPGERIIVEGAEKAVDGGLLKEG